MIVKMEDCWSVDYINCAAGQTSAAYRLRIVGIRGSGALDRNSHVRAPVATSRFDFSAAS